MEEKINCSVGILTFNSGASLRQCLESVKEFSEIIICDGGSTDDTLSIAKEFNCVIISQDNAHKYENGKIADFSGVRNQTLDTATNEWFLILDSDEFLTNSVVLEIKDIVKNNREDSEPKLYQMPRKLQINGRVIDHASSYPGYQPRFFHKPSMVHFARKLHEKIVPKSGIKVAFLKEATIAPIELDYKAWGDKFRYYLNIEKERSRGAKKINLLKSTLGSFKSALSRIYKVLKYTFFAKGTKMPLKFEMMLIRYSLSLSVVFLGTFVKK